MDGTFGGDSNGTEYWFGRGVAGNVCGGWLTGIGGELLTLDAIENAMSH